MYVCVWWIYNKTAVGQSPILLEFGTESFNIVRFEWHLRKCRNCRTSPNNLFFFRNKINHMCSVYQNSIPWRSKWCVWVCSVMKSRRVDYSSIDTINTSHPAKRNVFRPRQMKPVSIIWWLFVVYILPKRKWT